MKYSTYIQYINTGEWVFAFFGGGLQAFSFSNNFEKNDEKIWANWCCHTLVLFFKKTSRSRTIWGQPAINSCVLFSQAVRLPGQNPVSYLYFTVKCIKENVKNLDFVVCFFVFLFDFSETQRSQVDNLKPRESMNQKFFYTKHHASLIRSDLRWAVAMVHLFPTHVVLV